MASDPLVSIVIPTRNRKELLHETLVSVCSQTYPNWEAVVVDDFSNDDTVASVKQNYGSEDRIKIVQRAGTVAGAPVCRNQGFSLSQGKYVIFLDSDDLLDSRCLEQRVAVIEGEPGNGFAVFQGELFANEPGDLKTLWSAASDEPNLYRFLKRDTPWQTTGPIWTRQALESLGGWDETLICWQDYDIHLRSLILGIPHSVHWLTDFYIRRDPSSKENIHSKNSSPEHLRARTKLLRKLYTMIRSSEVDSAYVQWLMTDAFLALAREWVYRRADRNEALSVWKQVYEEGIISKVQYYEGAFGLQYLEARRGLTRPFHAYLKLRWRHQ